MAAFDNRSFRKAASVVERVLFNGRLNRLVREIGRVQPLDAPVGPPDDFPGLLMRARKQRGDLLRVRQGYAQGLKAFTNFAFDFRQSTKGNYVERWNAKKARFSRRQMRMIHATSESLGMTGGRPARPKQSSYELGLVLGGRGAPVLMRMLHLRRMMEVDGNRVDIGKVGLMGCARPVEQDERDDMLAVLDRVRDSGIPIDQAYAERRIADAKTEFDMMSISAELVFGFRPDESADRVHQHGPHENSVSRVRPLGAPEGFSAEFVVVQAPSSDPENRRAITPDTYAFVPQVRELQDSVKDTVLVVNTQQYIFQEQDAYRMFGLPFGTDIEMCGYQFVPPYVAEADPRYLWHQGISEFMKELKVVERDQVRLLRKAGFRKQEAEALHLAKPAERADILKDRDVPPELAERILAGEARLMSFYAVPRNQLQEMNSAVDKAHELMGSLDLERGQVRANEQDANFEQGGSSGLSFVGR